MILPKRINIKGQVYSISRTVDLRDDVGDQLYGLCDRDAKSIQIDSTIKGKMLKLTLVHEIFHAALTESHVPGCIGHEIEELIVDALSEIVCDKFNLSLKSGRTKNGKKRKRRS